MPPIIIRNAASSDAPFLSRMIYQSGTTIQRALLKNQAEKIMTRLATSENGLFSFRYGYLATRGEENIGAMICYPAQSQLKETTQYIRQFYHLADIGTFCTAFFKQALLSLSILPKLPGDFYLAHIAVDNHGRSQGVGQALLGKLEELAQRHKAGRIVLDVELNNPRAKTFYERNGFKEEGRKSSVVSPSFLGTPGFIRMVKDLSTCQT